MDLIAKTMPEDDPGMLSTKEAQPRRRLCHPRLDVFRNEPKLRQPPARRADQSWPCGLTVRQYRSTVADLIGSFRYEPIHWSDASKV